MVEQVQDIPTAQLEQLYKLAGSILSKQGASKGGKARAEALSSGRRKEIAQMGGAASSMARRPHPKIVTPDILKKIKDVE